MSKCNNIDWIHFSQVCDNMKYCPVKIEDNIFYTPLDKFNNDKKVNRFDKLNFKKDRLVIYKDILGNVKKGLIFKNFVAFSDYMNFINVKYFTNQTVIYVIFERIIKHRCCLAH